MILRVAHAAGSFEWSAYRIRPREAAYERRSELNVEQSTPTTKFGDTLARPFPLSLDLTVWDGTTVEEAASLAYRFVEWSRTAYEVETYDGVQDVLGLLSYHIQPEPGLSVTLRMDYLPAEPTPRPMLAMVVPNAASLTDSAQIMTTFLEESGYRVAHRQAAVGDVGPPPVEEMKDVSIVLVTSDVHQDSVRARLWHEVKRPVVTSKSVMWMHASLVVDGSPDTGVLTDESVVFLNTHRTSGVDAAGSAQLTDTPGSVSGASEGSTLAPASNARTVAHRVADAGRTMMVAVTAGNGFKRVGIPLGRRAAEFWLPTAQTLLLHSLDWGLRP